MLLVSRFGDYRSMSGGRLSKDRLVRLIYIDEAGVSNPSQEPYLVVSGVILNGDQDWHQIDRHVKSLVRKHIPEDDQFDFIFHAMDIWHGSRYFDRNKWPREKRQEILTDLAKIPAKFNLTIVTGFVARIPAIARAARYAREIGVEPPSIASTNMMIHADAFALMAKSVDRWMRRNAPREVAMLVAENTGRVQSMLKGVHAGYVSDNLDEYWFDQTGIRTFKTTRIIDTVHFAAKRESTLLQVADVCAFFTKRQLMKRPDSYAFFELFAKQLFPPPRRDGAVLLPTQTRDRTTIEIRLLPEPGQSR